MTPFAELCTRIGWSAPKAASRLGYASQTCDRWRVGTNTRGTTWNAPPDVLDKLRRVAEAIDRELGR